MATSIIKESMLATKSLQVTVDSTKVSNPSSIYAYRVGKVVVVTFWGTKFTSSGSLYDVVRGVPTAVISASGYLALGGNDAYNIQGNVYVSGNTINCGMRTNYATGTPVYGSVMYLAQ